MPTDGIEQIGQKIKEQRKSKGWSQQALADMAGLDRTTIGALERNSYNDIGIRKVQRVLALLNMTLSADKAGLPTLDDLVKQKAR